jgi:hypothetical protein
LGRRPPRRDFVRPGARVRCHALPDGVDRARTQTCIIIYFFGDLRQLHRWELARPVPSSTDLAKVDSAASTSSDDLGKSPADSTAALFSADPFLGASTTRPPSYTSTWDGAKMFSPVTRVEDPVVIAEQRRRVINGATCASPPGALLDPREVDR